MLSVKNLKKSYATRAGTVTKALDGVSIDFPERGMVFILGKSGSGKSTLLNVAGGLDRPDGGEIIVKGKSSKDFSAADFDGYRNTYVGFVFQEYNILSEFNVEQNISLALQLQGKKNDKAAVDDLLKKVDLDGYGRRKPNTLSGGQKQRVAIARALIKDPEIIMADEPTGALDSKTGKDVMDTLKKLSEEKLVLVVSHDREFAERYGDRIIELKDGKVISDTTKTFTPPAALSANVSAIGGDTIRIKDWNSLTDADISRINAALKNTKSEVIISANAADVAAFKRIGKISDDGSKESFVTTDTSAIVPETPDGGNSKFIRSNMPFSRALRMGASSLKTKPGRLFFTILLSVISFTMFGVLSAMMLYDPIYSISEALRDSALESVVYDKYYWGVTEQRVYDINGVPQIEYQDEMRSALFGKSEIEALNADNDFGLDFAGVYSVGGIYNVSENQTNYYYPIINGITGITDCGAEYMQRSGFELVTGEYPTAANEIALTLYTFEFLSDNGFMRPNGSVKSLRDPVELVGEYVFLDNARAAVPLKITGIYDTHLPSGYEELKDLSTNAPLDMETESLIEEFDNLVSSSYHVLGYVADGFYDRYSVLFDDKATNGYMGGVELDYNEDIKADVYSYTQYMSPLFFDPDMPGSGVFSADGKKPDSFDGVSDNEIYLSLGYLYSPARALYDSYISYRVFETAEGEEIRIDGSDGYDPFYGWTMAEGFYVNPETYDVSLTERESYIYISGYGYINEFGEFVVNPEDAWELRYGEVYVNGDGDATLNPERYYYDGVYYRDPESGEVSLDYVDGWDEIYGYIFSDGSIADEILPTDYCLTESDYYVSISHPDVVTFDIWRKLTDVNGYYVYEDGSMSIKLPEGYEIRSEFYDAGNGHYTVFADEAAVEGMSYNGFYADINGNRYLDKDDGSYYNEGFFLNDKTGDVSLYPADGYRRVRSYAVNYETGDVIHAVQCWNRYINDETGEVKYDPSYDLFEVYSFNGSYGDMNPEYAAALEEFEAFVSGRNTEFIESGALELILRCMSDDWDEYAAEEYGYDPDYMYIVNANGKKERLNVAGYYYVPEGILIDYRFMIADSLAEEYNYSISWSNDDYADTFESDYVPPEDARYNYIISFAGNSLAECHYMLDLRGDGIVQYGMTNSVYNDAYSMSNILETFKMIFLIAGSVFAVFSALMLFNFISASISAKSKEIGILRAVGARGTDVFKIFFSEAGIIALICFAIAAVLSGLFCMVLNGIFMSSFFAIRVLDYGIINIALIFGISFAVSFLATIIPVSHVSKKSPVESIRAL